MGAIAIVGSVNRDVHLTVDDLPGPGETVLAQGLAVNAGGKGANQALAVAAAQEAGHLIAAVGDDAAGAAVLETLRTHGVDITQVHQVPGSPTGTAVVTVDSHGENNIVVASGANLALTAEQAGTALRAIPDVTTVLTQGEVSPAVVSAAADHARACGARFVLNLAPYRTTELSILKQCDPLVVNEVEAAALATELELDSHDLGELAFGLGQLCQSVVITAGADGAWCARDSTVIRVPAPMTEVVDTTGAGDAFVGALTAQLDRSGDLVKACRAGVEAGSRAVQHRGAQP